MNKKGFNKETCHALREAKKRINLKTYKTVQAFMTAIGHVKGKGYARKRVGKDFGNVI